MDWAAAQATTHGTVGHLIGGPIDHFVCVSNRHSIDGPIDNRGLRLTEADVFDSGASNDLMITI